MITGNYFKIISSDIGKGAFCVLEGNILETTGHIKVEIHTAFKVLLSVILIMPLVGFFLMMADKTHEFNIIYPIFSTLLQIVFLRFVVIEVAFRILSKQSLIKLRDVLDVEWVS